MTTEVKRKKYYPSRPIFKYAVFAGETFYPAGGFEDFYGFAKNYEEAYKMSKEAVGTGVKPRTSWWCHDNEIRTRGPCDWSHVVNLKKQKIIHSNIRSNNDDDNDNDENE